MKLSEKEIISELKSIRESFFGANGKATLPENLDEVLARVDEVCRDRGIDTKIFRDGFTTFSVALFHSYRVSINSARRKALKSVKAGETPLTTRAAVSGGKLPREDMIPKTYAELRSVAALAALTFFSLCSEKPQLQATVMLAALSGYFSSAKDVLRLTKSPSDLKRPNAIPEYNELSKPEMLRFIQALLISAEYIREQNFAKLAVAMSEESYFFVCDLCLKKREFKTMYPYEPLRTKYLKGSVGQNFIRIEHDKLTNQHKTDPQRTVKFLLEKAIESANLLANSQTSRRSKSLSVKFDPNITYNVFVGPLNYMANLTFTNYSHKGRVYRITTYNDCLYDLMGSQLENTTESTLYNNLSWIERLEILPYRAKIELKEMSGKELNAYRGHALLTVSWIESDGLETTKTVEVRNERRKLVSNEQK